MTISSAAQQLHPVPNAAAIEDQQPCAVSTATSFAYWQQHPNLGTMGYGAWTSLLPPYAVSSYAHLQQYPPVGMSYSGQWQYPVPGTMPYIAWQQVNLIIILIII